MNKRNNGRKTLLFIMVILLIASFIVAIPRLTYTSEYGNENSEKKATSNPDVHSCEGDHNLPVVIIDTDGQNIETISDSSINEKTDRYNVDFSLYDVNSDGTTCMDPQTKPAIKEKVEIGIRGQSSRINPKKQFSLKFMNETGGEKDVSLLNMPKDNEWVLNGVSADSSLIRNHLAYQVSGEIMAFAPETRFVEVYILDDQTNEINDVSYRGVYMLMEKITRSSDRVNITKTDERYTDTSFIIARDKIKVGEPVIDSLWSSVLTDQIVSADGTVKKRSRLTYVYPGKARITDNQKQIIDDYINDFELTLYSRDFTNKRSGYRKYIDVKSFVDYAIINDFFNNVDGGDVSTYFYRDIGGRLHAGPVWDFDLTLGLPENSPYSSAEGFKMFNTTWFDQLFKDPYFVDTYIERYQFLRKNVLSEEYLYDLIDRAVEELGDAIQRNHAKWNGTTSQAEEYEKEIQQMKDYIAKRASWIDQNTAILYRMNESDL
ncbi:CotH kinase family protein [Paenibacillus sp. GYB006]|uniref:CotH kinase family protein n=1 Tax=Paenibacillus sp. GYB006 TaxID=2994394 RepID=UPI002F96BDFF